VFEFDNRPCRCSSQKSHLQESEEHWIYCSSWMWPLAFYLLTLSTMAPTSKYLCAPSLLTFLQFSCSLEFGN